MKKAFSFLFTLVLCLSFAGCAEPRGNTGPETQVPPVFYDSAKVSYLGPEGTYTQEACGLFFDNRGEYIPYPTVPDAVQALNAGETDYAVIPQENTIGGAVTDYVDILIAQDGVFVTGEVELPISQNLLALHGAELSGIKTVYSHKQGITQGREWLEKNLPDAEVVEVSSTAGGAKLVAENNDPSLAAIASAGCAEVYDLEILAAGIQNNDRNKTRFYVLTREEPAAAAGDRLVFIAQGAAKDLPALMAGMQKQKMTLVTIHDRPLKTELGQYSYLIECSGSSYKSYRDLIRKLPFEFRFLGCFDVKGTP